MIFAVATSAASFAENAMDGTAWLEFDTNYTSGATADWASDKSIEFLELPFSRVSYAIELLDEVEWVEVGKSSFETYLIQESEIPEGAVPYLVRAVVRHSAGGHFVVFEEDGTLMVKYLCIVTREEPTYKSPIVVFLEKPPKALEVHYHELGW